MHNQMPRGSVFFFSVLRLHFHQLYDININLNGKAFTLPLHKTIAWLIKVPKCSVQPLLTMRMERATAMNLCMAAKRACDTQAIPGSLYCTVITATEVK